LTSFINEDDIKQLRAHEGFVELQPGEENGYQKEIPQTDENAGQEVLKKRGRPRKQEIIQ